MRYALTPLTVQARKYNAMNRSSLKMHL